MPKAKKQPRRHGQLASPGSLVNGVNSSAHKSPEKTTAAQPGFGEILRVLREISSEHNDRIISYAERQKWHAIDNIPKKIHDLGLGVPLLVPAQECWQGAPPTTEDLKTACVAQKIKAGRDVAIERHGSGKATVQRLLDQLEHPDPVYPLVGHNVSLPDVPQMRVPKRISELYTIQSSDTDYEQSMNITPKYAAVDAHYDQGTSGISITIGRCTKVWLLWPPTAHNLSLLEANWGLHPRRVINSAFEHGVVALLDSSQGIFLPAGWLHTTLTVAGGFLYGITFTTAQSVATVSACFAQECRVNPTGFENVGRVYANGLETALDADADADTEGVFSAAALRAWLPLETELRRFAWTGPAAPPLRRELAAHILAVWSRFLDRRRREGPLLRWSCACRRRPPRGARGRDGEEEGEGEGNGAFAAHFWEAHLGFLSPDADIDAERRR